MNKYTYEEVKSLFEAKGFKLLDTEYKGTQIAMNCICSCGNVTRLCLNNLNNGRRCRKCGTERIKMALQGYTFEEVKTIYSEHNFELVSYKGTQSPLNYLCSCGNETSIIATTKLIMHPIKCKFCRSIDKSIKTRGKFAYQEFRLLVLNRDNNTCTECGIAKFEHLHVHHMNGWDDKVTRFNANYSITLCASCHKHLHNKEI